MLSSTSSSRVPATGGLPFALFIALLAYAVSDRFLWSYPPWLRFCARYAPLYSAHDYPMRTAVRIGLLQPHENEPPILLLGSSQVYEGLSCARFRRRFPGRTCENLGIAVGSPMDMLFLLDLADQRAKKRVTVVAFLPSTLHQGPKPAFTDLTTLLLLVKGGALLHMSPREWVSVVDGLLQSSSETLRMSASLQALWTFVGQDPWAALRHKLPPLQLREFLPRPLHELRKKMGRVLDPEATPGRFTRANELAIEEILSLEAHRGNRVVLVDCPTRDGYETTLTPEAVLHYRRLLDHLAVRPEVMLVRRDDLPQLGDEDFRDFVHMMPPGRDKTSVGLAEILARTEAASRP
ncbi:MAG: hypothetical protein ACHQNV_03205 [Vicinamibacteria bacterium]